MTVREMMDGALACKTEADADAWMATEIERRTREYGQSPATAEAILRENLGYCAGYYDHEAAEKVRLLFGATHPIFGSNYHMERD